MENNRKNVTTGSIKARSLDKYKDKNEVTNKWIELNKNLNPNKNHMYYNGLIIEAVGVLEYVIENSLKEDFVPNRFIDNVFKLRELGVNITDKEFNKLKRIKWYRNIGAHNTGTSVQEIISYEIIKDTFISLGTVLNKLGLLDEEDIIPMLNKLQAKEREVIGETCLLQEILGQGSSGKVFKAYHQRLDLTVAVKEINHEIIESIDIANEKEMLLSLNYPGIPRMYDVIQDNQTYYLVMDYIKGETLERNIEAMGSLPLKAVLRIGTQLCNIMSYLHNFKDGIIFRDLKPSNIMLDTDNNVYVIDFGIAQKATNINKNQNLYSGTISYASPEQLRAEECDVRSDIYSLGATLYFITEGQNPTNQDEQRFKRNTPEKLINIIEKAMSYDKYQRYSSMNELKTELQEYQTSLNNGDKDRNNNPTSSKEITSNYKKNKNKNKFIITGASVAALIIIIIFGIAMKNILVDNKEASIDKNNINVTTKADNSSENQHESKNVKTIEVKQDGKNDTNSDEGITEVKGATTKAFNKKATLTVNKYEVKGSSLVVNATVENKHDKEFQFALNNIYVMNEKGTKFDLDTYAMLANGINNFKFAPDEKAEIELIFKNYSKSNELKLTISNLFCFGDFSKQAFNVKFK